MISRKIGFGTAISLVIANMIGTGVFTSLGYQVAEIKNVFALMTLWTIGGIVSLCGALVYGEMGKIYPNSGGEYNYLAKIYHPSIGFLAGWVSATVGFSAPIAMAAMALASYVKGVFSNVNEKILAISVILIITLIHSSNLKTGSTFQRIITILKVVVILFFIGAGFLYAPTHQAISLSPQNDGWQVIFSGSFAIALYWVTFSYSGWNASAYMAAEIENPKKNLPKSLLIGTLVVTVIYLLINFIFLYTAPINELVGQKDIGLISAKYIFGQTGGKLMGMLIAFLLVSAVSSMVMTGPRVIESMGKDIRLLNFFSITNKKGIPFIAIITQSAIAITLVLSTNFDFVLQFTAFSLNIFTFLTVLGIFFAKSKTYENKYQKFLLIYTPATLFLVFQLWILYFGLKLKPDESALGFINLGIGLLFWFISKFAYKTTKS